MTLFLTALRIVLVLIALPVGLIGLWLGAVLLFREIRSLIRTVIGGGK